MRGASRRGFRAYEMPVAHGPSPKAGRRLALDRPIRFTFPPSDHDWSAANLPTVRAAIGILSLGGPELVVAQREASERNPFYPREMARELSERIAHFEHLVKLMRQARERIETAAAYVEAEA